MTGLGKGVLCSRELSTGELGTKEGQAEEITFCLSICVFVTDISRLRLGQPLQGAGRGATTFYTSSVDA